MFPYQVKIQLKHYTNHNYFLSSSSNSLATPPVKSMGAPLASKTARIRSIISGTYIIGKLYKLDGFVHEKYIFYCAAYHTPKDFYFLKSFTEHDEILNVDRKLVLLDVDGPELGTFGSWKNYDFSLI